MAGALGDAKAAGYLGEKPNGYVGIVNPNAPAHAHQLADRVNSGRRDKYRDISRRSGTSLNAIEAVAGQKLQKRVRPGEYYMPSSGAGWRQR